MVSIVFIDSADVANDERCAVFYLCSYIGIEIAIGLLVLESLLFCHFVFQLCVLGRFEEAMFVVVVIEEVDAYFVVAHYDFGCPK